MGLHVDCLLYFYLFGHQLVKESVANIRNFEKKCQKQSNGDAPNPVLYRKILFIM